MSTLHDSWRRNLCHNSTGKAMGFLLKSLAFPAPHVHGCSLKSFMVVYLCHQLGLTDQLHLSANDKGNEVKSGAVHRSPGIYFIADENLS